MHALAVALPLVDKDTLQDFLPMGDVFVSQQGTAPADLLQLVQMLLSTKQVGYPALNFEI